jgi:hypothetical protein
MVIHRIIDVALSVSTPAWLSMGMSSRRLRTAGTRAPATPTAADSVGVAIPKKIDPRISTISIEGNTSALSASSLVRRGTWRVLASSGTHSGLSQPTTTM